jgi:hypothetical protein
MFRHKSSGARFVTMRQMSDALKIPITALLDLMTAHKLDVYQLNNPVFVQQLRDIGQHKGKREWCTTAKLASVISLLRRMHADEEEVRPVGNLVQPFTDAARSQPPTSASMLGMQPVVGTAADAPTPSPGILAAAAAGPAAEEEEEERSGYWSEERYNSDEDERMMDGVQQEPQDAGIPSPPFVISPPGRAAIINTQIGRPRRILDFPTTPGGGGTGGRRAAGIPLMTEGDDDVDDAAGDVLLSPTPLALRDFPTTMEAVYLTAEEKSKPYGLGDAATRPVLAQVAAFIRWSEADIQLDRDARYATAAQTTTTGKHADVIKAFLGYTVHIRGDYSKHTVTLAAYKKPDTFMGFVSFLIARGVGRGHILKHLSVARKVNCFLTTG